MNFNRELALKLVNAVFDMIPEDYQFGPVCEDDQIPTNFKMIYDEAKKVIQDNHYNIELVKVSTFKEAIADKIGVFLDGGQLPSARFHF